MFMTDQRASENTYLCTLDNLLKVFGGLSLWITIPVKQYKGYPDKPPLQKQINQEIWFTRCLASGDKEARQPTSEKK